MTRAVLLGALCLLLTGCGDDGGDGDDGGSTSIASGNLTGKVGGMSWTLAAAQTDAFFSDETELWVNFYAEAAPACGSSGSGNSVILIMPNKVGSYALSLQLNGTFVIDNASQDNLIATRGALRIDEITGAQVRGGLSMTYDAANSISGEFAATICP